MKDKAIECENLKYGDLSCFELYNCCDCGTDEKGNGCGCAGCFSCNACDFCKEERNH